jgi:hypothetical protein
MILLEKESLRQENINKIEVFDEAFKEENL